MEMPKHLERMLSEEGWRAVEEKVEADMKKMERFLCQAAEIANEYGLVLNVVIEEVGAE